MTPKQKAIESAYGGAWGCVKAVTSDGWALIVQFGRASSNRWDAFGFSEDEIETRTNGRDVYWRPVELKGLESNHGWRRFDEHLPAKDQFVHVLQSGRFYVGKITIFESENNYYLRTYSHWMPVEEMPLPIY
ncbi:hypothetical protein SAMN04487996_107130 [Dyadobacter soli]|uniref:DUF551 domain-containing protein n=1 Tax=Dyadobacter soli TaxID=659014 RepID=A0A1G7G5G4_9BACT|nr:hypothetical protein SAMN04487996_107130 [Dyadobacter soli]